MKYEEEGFFVKIWQEATIKKEKKSKNTFPLFSQQKFLLLKSSFCNMTMIREVL